MKILGLDIGDKRIGLAISDKEKRLSLPLTILENDNNFLSTLEKIISDNCIEILVIGMPYTLKGEIGKQGQKIIDFVEDNISEMGIEITYIDERFTSRIPVKEIKEPLKIKKDLDKLSAALILQSYLDKNNELKKN